MNDHGNKDDDEPRSEEPWQDKDDEPGDEEEARPGRFDGERWLRRLDFVLQRHEFPTRRAFDRFLESEEHRAEAEKLDEPLTIEEEAQEMAYLALETEDEEAAENYARDAVALDPDCVDARVLLSLFVTDDLNERIWLLERAVDCGRWRFESAKTGDMRDHYLQRIESKPLIRALQTYSDALIEGGDADAAEKLLEESSLLPSDEDDDPRYPLAVFFLRFGKLDKARVVIEHLPADDVARDWCEILERFLAGARDEAVSLLVDARPKNFHVESYLTGDVAIPKGDERESLSDEQDDAIWIADTVRPAWEAHREALEWLRGA